MPEIKINNLPETHEPKRIKVETPQGVQSSYTITIDHGMIDALGSTLRTVGALCAVRKLFVVTDSNVALLYLDRTIASLKMSGFACVSEIIPAGETSKSMQVVETICEKAAEAGIDRSCGFVALGGGVVGDLTGFAAAVYMRGIPVIQVPTTLLAMIDSSIGGKTAVNLEAGKNLVGAFWQPSAVIIDLDTLATLPINEWKSGLGEAAKMSLLGNDEFFFYLYDNAKRFASQDFNGIEKIITWCIEAKLAVVAADERETNGIREQLNLGHTIGHAVEKVTGYGTYSHGECVAFGIRVAAAVAQKLYKTDRVFTKAQTDLLTNLGFKALKLEEIEAQDLVRVAHADKKNKGPVIRMVLLKDIGVYETESVDDDVLLKALVRYCKKEDKLAEDKTLEKKVASKVKTSSKKEVK